MMTSLNLARIAKLVALFGFFLPWVLVSCSGQPVGKLSGVDLATGGTLTLPGSGDASAAHADLNLWVMLSLLAVLAGLAASILAKGRGAFAGMAAAAAVALAASGIGIATAAGAAAPTSVRASAPDLSAGGIAQVNLQYGYFITLAGLLTALGASVVGLSGRGANRDSS